MPQRVSCRRRKTWWRRSRCAHCGRGIPECPFLRAPCLHPGLEAEINNIHDAVQCFCIPTSAATLPSCFLSANVCDSLWRPGTCSAIIVAVALQETTYSDDVDFPRTEVVLRDMPAAGDHPGLQACSWPCSATHNIISQVASLRSLIESML